MDDQAPKENAPENFPAVSNKLDLSQLQSFSFGTQWAVDKTPPSDGRDRPRREDRRDGPGGGFGGGGGAGRDRRAFRKPAGPGGPGGGGAPTGGAPARAEFSGDRPPRRDGPAGGEFRGGGPRRDAPGGGDFRGGPRRGGFGGRDEQMDRGPYESPFFNVTFYPEDTSFDTLVQTIRKSSRTIELFEIARTVVAKSDRFVVVVTRKAPGEFDRPAPAAEAAAPRPAKQPIYVAVPDGLPFDTEDAAITHVMSQHLDKFFDLADVEVDAPKGNYQVVNKCGVTGELLAPPNYHRYNQIVQQHHAAKAARMSLEALRARIETIRDPEAVAQWLEKMKKTTRYTWKTAPAKRAAAAPTDGETPAPAAEAPAESPAPAADAAAPAPAETPAPLSFDAFEDARLHLLTHARDRLVRPFDHARFHGKVIETMPPGEIRRAVEGAIERQRRFPLDTANALRGRLRREHFTIFKKGSKGVSYVCAVKRKFRVPGQTFADSIDRLITFIEQNPMVRASELPAKLLGLAAPRPAPAAAPVATPATESAETPAAPAPAHEISIEDRARIAKLNNDLAWLVREGYVTEFINGSLYAAPAMVEARKKEVEAEEHDPENFPEAPPAPVTSESIAEAPADSTTVAEAPVADTSVADVPVPAAETPAAEPATAAATSEVPVATEPAASAEAKPGAPSA